MNNRHGEVAAGMVLDGLFLGAWLILHSVARSFNDDGVGMMEESIQHGGGNGAVVIENRGPLFEGLVGGEGDGSSLIALTDHLEEEISPLLIDGQITDLIQN